MFRTSDPIPKLKISYEIFRRRKNLNYSLFIRFCLPTLFPTFETHFLSFASFPDPRAGPPSRLNSLGARRREARKHKRKQEYEKANNCRAERGGVVRVSSMPSRLRCKAIVCEP